MLDTEQPIDAVVMWVDGSSEAFQQSEKQTLKEEKRRGKPVVHSAARHRDNGELRYLLRSIEYNMPWVRTIHIVTNGQKPDYVDFDQPGIVQVSHDEIFEDSGQLPCFNTFSIDSNTHRISGLSEHFIRFSDDFFVGRRMEKDEYLANHSAFIFTGAVQDEPANRYQKQIKNNADLMEKVLGLRPRYNSAHAPQLRSRSLCERFVDSYSEAITQTRDNKFRTETDLIPLFLYPYYALYEGPSDIIEKMEPGMDLPLAHVPSRAVTDRYAQVEVGKKDTDWQKKLNKLLKDKPAFFNLNDSFGKDSIDDGVAVMHEFLSQMFPERSRFEKPLDR